MGRGRLVRGAGSVLILAAFPFATLSMLASESPRGLWIGAGLALVGGVLSGIGEWLRG